MCRRSCSTDRGSVQASSDCSGRATSIPRAEYTSFLFPAGWLQMIQIQYAISSCSAMVNVNTNFDLSTQEEELLLLYRFVLDYAGRSRSSKKVQENGKRVLLKLSALVFSRNMAC